MSIITDFYKAILKNDVGTVRNHVENGCTTNHGKKFLKCHFLINYGYPPIFLVEFAMTQQQIGCDMLVMLFLFCLLLFMIAMKQCNI